MGYYNNNLFLFIEGEFNYTTMSNDTLLKILEDDPFLLVSFNADHRLCEQARGVADCDYIESLTRFLENAVQKFTNINILVSDCFAMQSIDGSKAKKGSSCKYIHDSLVGQLKKSRIAITFVSEIEDKICKRYFKH